MNSFANRIAEKYDLDADATIGLVSHFKLVEVDKNEHIIEKGGFNDNFYFIRKGILRAYISANDSEQTVWFGYPGQAIFDVWCYNNGGLSPIAIEAVIPCELYRISKAEIERMCSESLTVCNMIRKIFWAMPQRPRKASRASSSVTAAWNDICQYSNGTPNCYRTCRSKNWLPTSISHLSH